ncbi:hypothetical protein CPB84DRAFT_1752841 [Gymnopilus junonius]|uniref:Uncharacterized protein n=1 Tax=Gymnopilus junonius TaxID=109634 RepID=A0A9P5TFM8_GYMJU|nr:hypothetical protein CPB84DRAFT_1752841 [Gymnopilus junonius]
MTFWGKNLTGTYSDNIWTTIRDYTQLSKLKVVDLGRRDAFYPYPHPIFGSSFYYSPVDLAEGTGTGINGGTNDDEGVLLPGRVKTDRLRQLLHSYQNLEWLSLSIFDGKFLGFWGNPFTDISSILSAVIWPRLHTISLHDILVRSDIMANFLLRHPGITSLSAFLSLSEEDLPPAPFSLDSLQPNPSTIRKLHYIEQCDWSTINDEEDRDLSMLDDLWGVPENLRRNNCGQDGGHNWVPLVDMHNLRSLAVRSVRRFKQLEEVAELMPDLQRLTIRRYAISISGAHPGNLSPIQYN